MILTAAVETATSRSIRARQLEAAFDVPASQKQQQSWQITAPLDARPWHVGAIIGPSGSGKTTLLREFGEPKDLEWGGAAVVDDFSSSLSLDEITAACSAVGFNTIPAWLRPFSVLSNGEQFRATMARLLSEPGDSMPITIDEFTSVVDRQVAKIASHAVAKYTRKQSRQLVVASCHYDIVDWLQPDWIIDPVAQSFTWREVSPRPKSVSRSRPVSIRSGGGLLGFTI